MKVEIKSNLGSIIFTGTTFTGEVFSGTSDEHGGFEFDSIEPTRTRCYELWRRLTNAILEMMFPGTIPECPGRLCAASAPTRSSASEGWPAG